MQGHAQPPPGAHWKVAFWKRQVPKSAFNSGSFSINTMPKFKNPTLKACLIHCNIVMYDIWKIFIIVSNYSSVFSQCKRTHMHKVSFAFARGFPPSRPPLQVSLANSGSLSPTWKRMCLCDVDSLHSRLTHPHSQPLAHEHTRGYTHTATSQRVMFCLPFVELTSALSSLLNGTQLFVAFNTHPHAPSGYPSWTPFLACAPWPLTPCTLFWSWHLSLGRTIAHTSVYLGNGVWSSLALCCWHLLVDGLEVGTQNGIELLGLTACHHENTSPLRLMSFSTD